MRAMRAAILAGGGGTRIAGLYPSIPKPMIPISGKPLLAWQVESLVAQGIADITLIIGYKAEQIKSYFGEGKAFGANIDYIIEAEPLGTGGALVLLPRADTLVLYGDVYCEIDYWRFIHFHRDKQAEITLFAHPNSHPWDSDIVVCDDNDQVKAWKSKKDSNRGELRNLVNAGLYVFSKSALPVGAPAKTDLELDLVRPKIMSGKVYAYRSAEYVKDMGTPERLRAVENDIESGVAAARNLKNKQRAVFIDRDGTINVFRGFIDSPGQIELLGGTAEAIRLLNSSFYLAICITNQPVIARGMVTSEGLDAIHARLDMLLAENGAYLDDVFYCPHHPDKGYPEEVAEYKVDCECRKPKPGMLLEAAKRYNIDLSRSYMIGDSTADIAAGKAAGCKTIGVRTGEGLGDGKHPDFTTTVCDDLIKAIGNILRRIYIEEYNLWPWKPFLG